MKPAEILATLHQNKVEVWVEGDRLRYRTREGRLAPSLKHALTQHKEEILSCLREKNRDVCSRVPLSPTQEAMWVLHQAFPESFAYNVSFSARIQSVIDLPALESAFQALVDRHASLRTTYSQQDGKVFQVIQGGCPFTLGQVDVSSKSQEQILARVLDESRKVFDLQRGPIFRATVFSSAQDDHILLIGAHHIAVDGWSVWVLLDELRTLYAARVANLPASLPQVTHQYTDFVQWQEDFLNGIDGERLWAYWEKQLAGDLPVLNLWPDRPRMPIQQMRGGTVSFSCASSLTKQIKAFSKSEGVTLYTVLLAVFKVILFRYTQQSDLLVGTYSSGRTKAEFSGVVGCCVNPVIIRSQPVGTCSFKDYLHEVRKTVFDALTHQDYPFSLLAKRLHPHRDLSHAPLFQVDFVLQKPHRYGEISSSVSVSGAETEPIDFGGLDLEYLFLPQQEGQLDLTLEMMEGETALLGNFKYNSDLFEHETIQRLAGQYQQLLKEIVTDPSCTLGRLPMLPLKEQQKIFLEWNHVPSQEGWEPEVPVHRLIEREARKNPAKVAVVMPGKKSDRVELTYQSLNERANQVGRALQAWGVGPGSIVAVHLPRSCEAIISILGILKTGAAYLPLDEFLPKERLATILRDAQASVVVTQASLRERVVENQVRILALDSDESWIAGQDSEDIQVEGEGHQLAYVIFTSGSTGKPNGVMVEHRHLMNVYRGWEEVYHLHEIHTHLQMASFSFDVFSGDVIRALCSGARLVICPKEWMMEPARLFNVLEREHIECAEFVPVVLRGLVDYMETEQKRLPSFKLLVCGSDIWSKESFEKTRHVFGSHTRVINSYGLTEATIDSSYFEVHGSHLEFEQQVPIGKPFPHTQLLILNQEQQLNPIGVPGEICVGGRAVARGYINKPELTKRKFPMVSLGENPPARIFRTGDLGRYLPDGTIQLLGRIDHQVKIRGLRIELGEVEAVLRKCKDVEEAVVLALSDSFKEPRLVAYLVSKEKVSPGELKRVLKTQLPEYMIPHIFLPIESLPLTAHGKVDRSALPKPDWVKVGRLDSFIPPGGPIEKYIADMIEDILSRGRVGIQDNFFELGGHSLHATQVISRIRERFKVELPIRAVFESPTVEGLARLIEEAQRAQGESLASVPPIHPVPREQGMPLSYSQQRMWFLNQLSPEGTAYNMPCALRLTGTLNRAALEQTMEEMFRRHEAFRTTFPTEEGTPIQMIGEVTVPKIPFVDLRLLSKEERVKEAQRLVAADARRPFDLASGPLARFLLIQLSRRDHVFLVTMHHIISDQWSSGIMGREFTEIYNALCRGMVPPVESRTIQYADFAEWQRQWLTGEVLEQQFSYWMNRLEQLPVLSLPFDHPRPQVETFRGASYALSLPQSLLDGLRQLGIGEDATLFMGLLAGFQALLFRYSGQQDFAIGVPIANRNQLAVENLVGTFVNTLVLRADLSGDPTFREVMVRVKERALEAYANQDLPFDKVVEGLRTSRDSSRAPLVQVLFNVANAPLEEYRLEGLEWEAFEFELEAAQFDLGLTIDTEISHKAYLQYNTDLFEASTIRRFVRQYRYLLESALRHPDTPISQLPILGADERYECLVQWNNTKQEFPSQANLVELFEQQVRQHPEAIAAEYHGEHISYQDLNRRANQLAHFLQAKGVKPERLVGICLERSLDMLVGLLGTLKAGGAYVPIDPTYPQQRLKIMLEDSEVALLLTQQHLLPILPEQQSQVVCIDSDWSSIAQKKDTNLSMSFRSDQLAYVIFTSGSTGRPKGVQIEHQSLVNFLWSMLREPGCGPDDVLLSVTTLSFDIAGLELFLPLLAGGRVLIVDREATFDGGRLIEEIEKGQPTLMQATPATWRMLLESGWSGQDSLVALCGGEALSRDLADQLLARTASVWNMYGPTETTIWSSLWKVDKTRPISIGRPIANTQMYILDQHGEPVPIGVVGELFIGGRGLARGYLKRPELTQERFIPDRFSPTGQGKLYRTGDLAKYSHDGLIQCLGRVDHQVKIRGFRVELGEIEKVLMEHPQIQQAVLVARAETPVEKRLMAYCVFTEQSYPAIGELRKFVLRKLPHYMVPAGFIPIDSVPLLPNGKVDFKALPEPTNVPAVSSVNPIPPRNSLEAQIMAIWEQVLGHSTFGVHDNFFDLGGHSLLAVQMFAQLEKVLKRRIPVAVLFQAPTIGELAAVLAQERSVSLWSSLVAIQPKGKERPLFLIPGAGGQVMMFVELSRLLGTDRPLYGLQPPGLDGKTKPFDNIEEIATWYVQEIQKVQPTGPYIIGGTCTGGVVAFEMAQQLKQQNQDVRLIIMETWHPRSIRSLGGPIPLTLSPLVFFLREAVRYIRSIAKLSPRHWLSMVVKISNKAKEVISEGDIYLGNKQLLDIDRMAKTTFKAVVQYSPKPYPGHVLNVIASKRTLNGSIADTRRVWGELSDQGHTTVTVPAENSGRLFVKPHVKYLAKELSTFLQRQ